MREIYEFDAEIHEVRDSGGAYVIFPWDIRREFGAGRVKVSVLFDGIAYDGSIVNMGVKTSRETSAISLGFCGPSERPWEKTAETQSMWSCRSGKQPGILCAKKSLSESGCSRLRQALFSFSQFPQGLSPRMWTSRWS